MLMVKSQVGSFFKNLAHALNKNNIQPGKIWNADETKESTVHKKIKQLGHVISAERDVLVTGVLFKFYWNEHPTSICMTQKNKKYARVHERYLYKFNRVVS